MDTYPIIDLSGYTEQMRLSLLDKTFFLEKIDCKVYFDYGCGDGSMIKFMAKLFPEYRFYGYDTNPDMVDLANKMHLPNAKFDTDFGRLYNDMRKNNTNKDCAIILSSVIHEAISYGKEKLLWEHTRLFDYICIRDMCVTDQYKIDADIIWKIANYYLDKNDDSYILSTFQKKWGIIKSSEQMIHFFLKYRYKNNWERELQENYLVPRKTLSDQLYGTKIIYESQFTLEFLKNIVKKDFDINLIDTTHIKMIRRRNKNGR